MVEDMNVGGVLLRKGKKRISINMIYFTFREAKRIKEWLEEAMKPRYRVKEEVREGFTSRFVILDYEYNYPRERVRFIDGDDFNAKKEAEKLCKQLNEGEE